MKWFCNNCNEESPARYCPRCGSECVEVAETSPEKTALVDGPRSVEIEGRFSQVFSPKSTRTRSIIIAVGTGALIVILAVVATLALTRPRAPEIVKEVAADTITIEKEAPAPKAEEKIGEDPGKPAAPPPLNVPAQKKVAKRAPPAKEKKPTPQPWRYRVETPAPAPKSQTQARPQGGSGNVLGKFFQAFEGPAPDVTPLSSDPRHTGQ